MLNLISFCRRKNLHIALQISLTFYTYTDLILFLSSGNVLNVLRGSGLLQNMLAGHTSSQPSDSVVSGAAVISELSKGIRENKQQG